MSSGYLVDDSCFLKESMEAFHSLRQSLIHCFTEKQLPLLGESHHVSIADSVDPDYDRIQNLVHPVHGANPLFAVDPIHH